MKIRCKVCVEYFLPDEETLALMPEVYLAAGDVNTCDDCWDMVNHIFNDDTEGMISDADPGL